jgi:hypothetical protein
MAMRKHYWNDSSAQVQQEKQALKNFLEQQQLFTNMQDEDLKYFFFSLPSQVIVKGYALGFMHERVQDMILQHITENKSRLEKRELFKVKYRM